MRKESTDSARNKIGSSIGKVPEGLKEEEPMHDWTILSHVRWDCKYHLVITPKYRKRKLYGKFKRMVGEVLKDLCRQRGIEMLEDTLKPDHVHMCLSIPLNTASPSRSAF